MTPLLAAPLSLRQSILLLNIAVAVFLVGVGIAAIRARRQRKVHAPNQLTYHDDDVLEGARLERVGAWALAITAVFAISLPAYWLIEPDRQEAMADYLLDNSVEQGAELFAPAGSNEVALGCADCHGPNGEGAGAPQIVSVPRADVEVAEGAINASDRVCSDDPTDETQLLCQVTWKAPSLDDVMLRFSRDEVRDIIVFGRPGTPMPAWGLEGGGAKNEQSVDNILDFIESIQISADEAKAKQADITDGRELFQANCARCHTKHWSYAETFAQSAGFDIFGVPGGGAFGPNLTGDVTLRQFPAIDDHIEFIRTGSDFQAAYGTRGIGSGRMPGFGGLLSDDQIRAIVEYERTLPDERGKLDDLAGGAEAAGAAGRDGEPEAEGESE